MASDQGNSYIPNDTNLQDIVRRVVANLGEIPVTGPGNNSTAASTPSSETIPVLPVEELNRCIQIPRRPRPSATCTSVVIRIHRGFLIMNPLNPFVPCLQDSPTTRTTTTTDHEIHQEVDEEGKPKCQGLCPAVFSTMHNPTRGIMPMQSQRNQHFSIKMCAFSPVQVGAKFHVEKRRI